MNTSSTFKKLLYTFLGSFFFFGMVFSAFAQTSEQNLSITITPRTPAPREEITITVESFLTDLNRATIRWVLDGVNIKEGLGEKVFRFTNGSLGETTTLLLIINTEEGARIERQFDFQPATVNLVWEAHTYTPPFYGGKALPTSNSAITITALPQFSTGGATLLSPENLVYTWSRDHRILGSKSGTGRQSITIEGPVLFQEALISVDVASQGRSLGATKSLLITSQRPEILLYEKHALLGVLYKKALTNTFSLTDEEVIIRAEPYFFSQEDVVSGLTFDWSLNGEKIAVEGRGQEVIFRQTELSGVARLLLQVNNVNKLLQGARRSLSLQFGLSNEFRF